MPPSSLLFVDSDEGAMADASSAVTTPEGSMSFSPVLRPHRVGDHIDDASTAVMATSLPAIRTICCVGAGYVGQFCSLSCVFSSCLLASSNIAGGPTAAVLAFQNPHIRVAVVDRDPGRIRRWNSRHPPIYEPGLADIVRIARDGSRQCTVASASAGADDSNPTTIPSRESNLIFSTDVSHWIAEADLVLISVNTPTKSRGAGAGSATDMTAFEAVTGEVAKHARPGAIIVEKSTVPCRTAQLVHETVRGLCPPQNGHTMPSPDRLADSTDGCPPPRRPL